jgi:hypothetical protein
MRWHLKACAACLAVSAAAAAAQARAAAAAAESARLRAWYLSRRDAADWAGGIDDDDMDAAADGDAAVRAHLARLTAFPLPLVIPRESLPQTQTQAPTS